jgi:hypothetical protein
MKRPIHEVDAQRERWLTYRRLLRLRHPVDDDFALGGLGAFAEGVDVRLVFLPSDPSADMVSLDRESLEWLKAERQSPYGGAAITWGHVSRTTSNALLLHDRYGPDHGWDRYLALYRHGGCEFGSASCTYDLRGTRIFSLRHIVGLAFSTLALQVEAISRWHLEPPFELTLALRNTRDATLGGFAEGWREPGQGLAELTACIEDHVLLRWELSADFEVEEVALDVGDRVEQAFGTTFRRHLARRGEYEGRFDPRFGY